ncbi:MAG: 2Fe-2S iron-sulfur cluster binding domain-containing protein [Pelistega sp.]|nr:2Fe-2S iron-sulfur cluster binding domain-containing protein [Pelistega sp.]
MSDNHLRWIPARVDEISEIAEDIKQFHLFLPSFTRFETLPLNAYVEIKTSTGVARQVPIVTHKLNTQEIIIEVALKDTADVALRDFYDNTALEQIIELTAPFSAHDRDDDIDFYVKLVRQGITLAIPKEVSITDVMRENGLKVNTSCEYGICGTCYTEVLKGEIIHKDTYLMDDEKAKQDCMMICVSRAAPGSTIELDL